MTILKHLVMVFVASFTFICSVFASDFAKFEIYNNFDWSDTFYTVKEKLLRTIIKKGDLIEEDRASKGSLIHSWTEWLHFADKRKFRTTFHFDIDSRLDSVQLFVDPAHRELLTFKDIEFILLTLESKYGRTYSVERVPDIQAAGGEVIHLIWGETSLHGMIFLSLNKYCPRNKCLGFSPVTVVFNKPNSILFVKDDFMNTITNEKGQTFKTYLEEENEKLHKRLVYTEKHNIELEMEVALLKEEIEQLLEMGA